MRIVYSARGLDDYLWWQQQDRKMLKRINLLIGDVVRHGNEGFGSRPVAITTNTEVPELADSSSTDEYAPMQLRSLCADNLHYDIWPPAYCIR